MLLSLWAEILETKRYRLALSFKTAVAPWTQLDSAPGFYGAVAGATRQLLAELAEREACST